MNISIIGTGYVGLCTALGFIGIPRKQNKVICVDIDKQKVNKINKGEATIYEEGIAIELKDAIYAKQIIATTDTADAVNNSEISFIAVGTPSREDGSIDLTYIKKVSEEIGKALKNKKDYHVVVVKSTVVPGTTEEAVIPIIEQASGKKAGEFGICMVPEFLREGKALHDFLHPDRIVIGQLNEKSGQVAKKVHEGIKVKPENIITTNIKTAEMIKYASNTFLAAKISLINEIGNICKKLGIDVYEVAKAVGKDTRIGEQFLQAGIGFGGSCFRKDTSALINKSQELGYEPKIIQAVLDTNKNQPLKITEILENKINVNGKKIAILGLAFKPGTDDVRDSPAIPIIEYLLKKGAIISAYDPKASENMKNVFLNISYCKSPQEALEDADACLVLTDWPEFSKLNEKDFESMNNILIIEGRRVLDKKRIKDFEGVAW